MLIDWFTVGAQAVNFLILVWLMKRFLYKPVLRAIDAREKRVAAELADADAKKAEAQTERDVFQRKNEEFDRQRTALLTQATDAAKAERQRLLDDARKAADALAVQRQEELRADARSLSQAIRRRTEQEVFAIARKALADLATTSLEERFGEVLTRRLRLMDAAEKAAFAEALDKSSGPVLVRSAFELPAEQSALIRKALHETFSTDVPVRFEVAPEVISGIELTAHGQRLSWSIASYLTSLEEGVTELLAERERPEVQPEAKAKPESKAKARRPRPRPKRRPSPEPRPRPRPSPSPKPRPRPSLSPKPRAIPGPRP